jgi:release factor glutamine methyltransferase
MTIKTILTKAVERLQESSTTTPQLDAEVLLSHTIKQERIWLHTHLEESINPTHQYTYTELIEQRLKGMPIAYLTEQKEFMSRTFMVNPDVLIPRPETETLVERVLEDYDRSQNLRIADIGTGSGVIAISLKLALPSYTVYGIDVSRNALAIAKKNAKNLDADIHFLRSNLFAQFRSDRIDVIVANLPYLVEADLNDSPSTNELLHEPRLALIAGQDGLAVIYRLIEQAPDYLSANGKVYLELEPRQIPILKQWVKQNHPQFLFATFNDLKNEERFVILELE